MQTEYRTHYPYRPRGFFFPIALITAGIVWLLVNNGTVPVENLYRLFPLWPVLLVLAGLGLMVRRIWWPVNLLMWAAAGALVIWLLTTGSVFLPKLSPLQLKHETLRQGLHEAASADVRLDLSIHPTLVHVLTGSQDLMVADVYTVNGMNMDASGSSQKVNVQLRESFAPNNFVFNPRLDQWLQASTKSWDIGLSPQIPISLTVDAGTGSTNLKLDGLKLSSLEYHAGTGSTEISLPTGQAALPAKIDMGTGSTVIYLPASTPVELTADGGTGGLQIILPSGAGAQVDVRGGGLGGLNLPPDFTKVSGNVQDKEGVYQNAAFTGSKTPVKIILDIGTGGVTVR